MAMNTIRVRVAKQQGLEFPFRVQVSMDNLFWYSLGKTKELDEALGQAKLLLEEFRQDITFKPTHILWKQERT